MKEKREVSTVLDLKQLSSFLTAARTLSFTKAAAELYMTQSALSKQIAALERSVGMPLFVRTNNALYLTQAGELLFREGEQLIERAEELEYMLRDMRAGVTGRLRVAVQNAFVDAAPGCFEEFKKLRPKVNFLVRYLQSQKLPGSVESGAVDVGTMHSFELDTEKYRDTISVMKLYKEQFCVMVSPKHPLARLETVRVSDLRGSRIIPLFDIRPPVVDEIIGGGSESHTEMDYPTPISFDDLLLQVKLGLGIALVVRPIARENNMGLKLLELEDVDTNFDILMIWRKDNINPVLPAFLDVVKKYFPNSEMA